MTSIQQIETDVVVIGAGPVGENIADRVVKGGLACTIVEKELVGGECSYWACMPSKALLRPSAALHAARVVQGAAEAVTGNIDAKAVFARRDSFTSNWDDSGQVEWLEGANVSLIRGTASVVADKRVRVVTPEGSEVELVARHAVVLANGSEPVIPDIRGLADVPYWGTREATAASEVPASLAVIGGGVAAVELAQAFARLGSKVTIMVRSELLSKFPSSATEIVETALVADGVAILKRVSPDQVSQVDDLIAIRLDNCGTVSASHLLVSTGRRPAISRLGLESVGLSGSRLEVDDVGRVTNVTSNNWLFAVGDVAGKVLLTHQGKYEARTTGDAIVAIAASKSGELNPAPWSRYRSTANAVAVPQVVFTDPELVQVGKSAEEAKSATGDIVAIQIPLSVAGSSLHADGYTGWAELVIDQERNVIVGATFVGQDVAELLHAATIAIVGEVPLDRLWHAVPSYPTISEIWLRLLEAFEQKWRDAGSPGRDPFNPAQ